MLLDPSPFDLTSPANRQKLGRLLGDQISKIAQASAIEILKRAAYINDRYAEACQLDDPETRARRFHIIRNTCQLIRRDLETEIATLSKTQKKLEFEQIKLWEMHDRKCWRVAKIVILVTLAACAATSWQYCTTGKLLSPSVGLAIAIAAKTWLAAHARYHHDKADYSAREQETNDVARNTKGALKFAGRRLAYFHAATAVAVRPRRDFTVYSNPNPPPRRGTPIERTAGTAWPKAVL